MLCFILTAWKKKLLTFHVSPHIELIHYQHNITLNITHTRLWRLSESVSKKYDRTWGKIMISGVLRLNGRRDLAFEIWLTSPIYGWIFFVKNELLLLRYDTKIKQKWQKFFFCGEHWTRKRRRKIGKITKQKKIYDQCEWEELNLCFVIKSTWLVTSLLSLISSHLLSYI